MHSLIESPVEVVVDLATFVGEVHPIVAGSHHVAHVAAEQLLFLLLAFLPSVFPAQLCHSPYPLNLLYTLSVLSSLLETSQPLTQLLT